MTYFGKVRLGRVEAQPWFLAGFYLPFPRPFFVFEAYFCWIERSGVLDHPARIIAHVFEVVCEV